MAHHTPAPLRTLGVLLRALLGLVVLVALVAGTPALLLAFGKQPTDLPGGTGLLTQQDDGTLFLTALTCIGWLGWAAFAYSVLVELVAVVRRRSAPRIRGLGGMQSLASFLIGGIVLLAPTAASATTTTPAVAVSVTHTTADTAPAASTSAPHTAPSRAEGPRHTVSSPTESPWDLAEQYLGDGTRWRDIAALNPDVTELATGDGYLPTGTVLRLPADARPAAPAAHTASVAGQPRAVLAAEDGETKTAGAEGGATKRPESVTVEAGDSLWSIAGQYGEPTDWPELYEANKGERQPGGGTFDDPTLIIPGQQLDLPRTGHHTEPPADRGRQDRPSADRDKPADSPAPSADSDGTSGEAQQPAPAPSRADKPVPASPSPSASADHTADAKETADSSGRQAGIIGIGATGVLAVGFLSLLGVRRVKQLRRLRRGQAVALPEGAAASTEHALRVAEATLDSSVLNTALRTLAVQLADSGAALPPLAAVLLGEQEIVLHLAAPAPAVAPFTAEPGSLSRWTCSVSSPELLPAQKVEGGEDPYPALVSLGWDPAGALVLVDLEQVGHLHLTGPGRGAVQRALALELATSEFTHHLDVSLTGEPAPGLAAEIPGRVTAHPSLAHVVPLLRAHHSEQQQAFTVLGTDGLRGARTGQDTAAAWTPHLVLAEQIGRDDAGALAELVGLVGEQPRSATALITSGELPLDLTGTSWCVHVDAADRLVRLPVPGTEVYCHLQALSDEDWTAALDILARSRAAAVPEQTYQSWLSPQPAQDEDEGEPVVAAEGGSSSAAPLVLAKRAEPAEGPGAVPSLAVFAAYEDPLPASGGADDEDEGGDGDTPLGLPPQDQDDAGTVSAAEAVPTPASPLTARLSTPSVSMRLPDPMADSPAAEDLAAVSVLSSVAPVLGPGVTASGPVIRVLGPVDIIGARGENKESNRERTNTELAAWLVLHPGRDHQPLDAAIWPHKDIDTTAHTKYRNVCISRLRSRLGTDEDGNPFLPKLPSSKDARYALADTVTSDWHQFVALSDTGSSGRGPYGTQALREALELVRGRPFMSDDRRRYRWAEPLAMVMLSKIVLTAEELAQRCLAERDPRGAVWAAAKGLDVAPEIESLYRILFQAYAALGDYDSLTRAADALEDINTRLGTETEDETLDILNELTAKA